MGVTAKTWSLASVSLAIVALACGRGGYPPPQNATDAMGPMDGSAVRRSAFTSGGHVTLGFRFDLPDSHATGERQVRLQAVFSNMDGEELTEDLGTYVGRFEHVPPAGDELGHVRFVAEDGEHEFTLHSVGEDEYELRMDGAPARRLELRMEGVRRREPLTPELTPPRAE